MNHRGEIARPGRASPQPTVALVNNAQREHQEFMASVEAVARENGAAIEALRARRHRGVPGRRRATRRCGATLRRRRAPTLTFALDGAGRRHAAAPHGTTTAGALALRTPAGRGVAVALHVAGRAQRAATRSPPRPARSPPACPLDAIVRGLEAFAPVKGRSQLQRSSAAARRVTLIDDTYNANPDSVRAAIDVLAALPAPRWLVLGDMGEVGDAGAGVPREVGAYARERGIDALLARRRAVRASRARRSAPARAHFDDVDALHRARSARRAGVARCWSRARASCRWSASSRR